MCRPRKPKFKTKVYQDCFERINVGSIHHVTGAMTVELHLLQDRLSRYVELSKDSKDYVLSEDNAHLRKIHADGKKQITWCIKQIKYLKHIEALGSKEKSKVEKPISDQSKQMNSKLPNYGLF